MDTLFRLLILRASPCCNQITKVVRSPFPSPSAYWLGAAVGSTQTQLSFFQSLRTQHVVPQYPLALRPHGSVLIPRKLGDASTVRKKAA
jgi:hypothetical protein